MTHIVSSGICSSNVVTRTPGWRPVRMKADTKVASASQGRKAMLHKGNISGAVAFFILLPAAMGSSPVVGDDVEIRWGQIIVAARADFSVGKYEDAARQYTSAVHQLEAAGMHDGRLAGTLGELGVVRGFQGRCAESSQLLMRGIKTFEAAAGPKASELIVMWQDLGAAYHCQRLDSKAERAYVHALDLEQNALAPQKARMAEILSKLGGIYDEEAKYSEAQAALERAQTV